MKKIICSIKLKDDLKDLEYLAEIQSIVKQDRLEEKLGKQLFHYELHEPITKTVKTTSKKTLEKPKVTTAANENVFNYVPGPK